MAVNQWYNDGDSVTLPVSKTVKWKIKVNGVESQQYEKHVDCTPLDTT